MLIRLIAHCGGARTQRRRGARVGADDDGVLPGADGARGPWQRTPASEGRIGMVLGPVSRGREGRRRGGRPTGGSRRHPSPCFCAALAFCLAAGLWRARELAGWLSASRDDRDSLRSCRRNRNRRGMVCPRTSAHSAMPRTPCASASLILALATLHVAHPSAASRPPNSA